MSAGIQERQPRPTKRVSRAAPMQGVKRGLPNGSRRYGQWAGTILFVVVMALVVGWLYQSKGDTIEVVVVQTPVAAGQVVESSDLGSAQVSGVGDAIPVSELGAVVGKRAVVGLVEGQVMTANAVTDETVPAEDERLVAVKLPAGRVPAGLASGSHVTIIAVPAEGTTGAKAELDAPAVLAESVVVHAVKTGVDGSLVVSVRVDPADADQVAAYSSAGRVTIVQTPAGE